MYRRQTGVSARGLRRSVALRQHYSLSQIKERLFEIIENDEPEDHAEEQYTLR